VARVSGQAIEEGTDRPVADANVFVVLDGGVPSPDSFLPSSVTDRNGRYHLDGLPAGRYRIGAHKTDFEPPMEPSTMQMFEVSGGQVLDGLIVPLRRGASITGRVLDSRGQPLAEAIVMALLKRLHSSDRPGGPASSGAPLLMPAGQSQANRLGEFRISGLLPGDYVIAANAPPAFAGNAASSAATIMTSTFFPGTADVSAAQPVTVQSKETVSDLMIRLVTVAVFQLSGVVVDESGAPVSDVMVMLMDGRRGIDSLLALNFGPRGMSPTDSGGRFIIGDVPSGSYTLRAETAGGFFGITDDFIIDGEGTPRGLGGPKRDQPPGIIEVLVENANITNLRIVVRD
jgi:protocatechuate 3,4-dioxygenase beta subunit